MCQSMADKTRGTMNMRDDMLTEEAKQLNGEQRVLVEALLDALRWDQHNFDALMDARAAMASADEQCGARPDDHAVQRKSDDALPQLSRNDDVTADEGENAMIPFSKDLSKTPDDVKSVTVLGDARPVPQRDGIRSRSRSPVGKQLVPVNADDHERPRFDEVYEEVTSTRGRFMPTGDAESIVHLHDTIVDTATVATSATLKRIDDSDAKLTNTIGAEADATVISLRDVIDVAHFSSALELHDSNLKMVGTISDQLMRAKLDADTSRVRHERPSVTVWHDGGHSAVRNDTTRHHPVPPSHSDTWTKLDHASTPSPNAIARPTETLPGVRDSEFETAWNQPLLDHNSQYDDSLHFSALGCPLFLQDGKTSLDYQRRVREFVQKAKFINSVYRKETQDGVQEWFYVVFAPWAAAPLTIERLLESSEYILTSNNAIFLDSAEHGGCFFWLSDTQVHKSRRIVRTLQEAFAPLKTERLALIVSRDGQREQWMDPMPLLHPSGPDDGDGKPPPSNIHSHDTAIRPSPKAKRTLMPDSVDSPSGKASSCVTPPKPLAKLQDTPNTAPERPHRKPGGKLTYKLSEDVTEARIPEVERLHSPDVYTPLAQEDRGSKEDSALVSSRHKASREPPRSSTSRMYKLSEGHRGSRSSLSSTPESVYVPLPEPSPKLSRDSREASPSPPRRKHNVPRKTRLSQHVVQTKRLTGDREPVHMLSEDQDKAELRSSRRRAEREPQIHKLETAHRERSPISIAEARKSSRDVHVEQPRITSPVINVVRDTDRSPRKVERKKEKAPTRELDARRLRYS
jgi:hypothetical protein